MRPDSASVQGMEAGGFSHERGHARPSGPATLREAIEWPWDFVAGLRALHGSLELRIRAKLERGIVLTSSFSGCGGAETALASAALGLSPQPPPSASAPAPPPPLPRVTAVTASMSMCSSADSSDVERLEVVDEMLSLTSEAESSDEGMSPPRPPLHAGFGRFAPSVPHPQIAMFSAADTDSLCRRLLLSHPSDSQPLHVFGDVLDRLPPDVLAQCKALESAKLGEYERCQGASGRAGSQGDGATRSTSTRDLAADKLKRKKVELGRALLTGLMDILSTASFAETAWCYRHNQYCLLHPRSNEELVGRLHIEIAGPCCPPWTTMNAKQDKWLSTATLPALVWAYSVRFAAPDLVIHENSPGWDEEPTIKILRGAVDCQVSCFSPDISPAFGCFQPGILCPTMFGRPSRRKRKYSLFVRRGSLRIALPPVHTFGSAFAEAFFRERMLTVGDYLCANDALVSRQLVDVVRRQGFSVDASEVELDTALPDGHWRRLQKWLDLAKEKGLVNDDSAWAVAAAVINTGQNASHMRTIDSDTAPALLRNSSLFDMVRGRTFVDAEYWVVQGYAPPELIPSALGSMFPAAGVELTSGQVRHLTGNGMHQACIGGMILAALAFTEANSHILG